MNFMVFTPSLQSSWRFMTIFIHSKIQILNMLFFNTLFLIWSQIWLIFYDPSTYPVFYRDSPTYTHSLQGIPWLMFSTLLEMKLSPFHMSLIWISNIYFWNNYNSSITCSVKSPILLSLTQFLRDPTGSLTDVEHEHGMVKITKDSCCLERKYRSCKRWTGRFREVGDRTRST